MSPCALVGAMQPLPETDLVATLKTEETGAAIIGARPLFADGFTCTLVRHRERCVYDGAMGLWTAWNDWLREWRTYVTGPFELVTAGNRVVVLMSARAVMKEDRGENGTHRNNSPQQVETSSAAIWTLASGRVASVTFYESRAEAFEAAGIVE